jgi:hypothetical protein
MSWLAGQKFEPRSSYLSTLRVKFLTTKLFEKKKGRFGRMTLVNSFFQLFQPTYVVTF